MYEIGDELGQLCSEITFLATVSDDPAAAYARIVKNGVVLAEASLGGDGGNLEFTVVPDGDRSDRSVSEGDWYRLDVLDQNSRLRAITNPIFVGGLPAPRLHKYGDFVSLSGGEGTPPG
jgi:hypothetical protein